MGDDDSIYDTINPNDIASKFNTLTSTQANEYVTQNNIDDLYPSGQSFFSIDSSFDGSNLYYSGSQLGYANPEDHNYYNVDTLGSEPPYMTVEGNQPSYYNVNDSQRSLQEPNEDIIINPNVYSPDGIVIKAPTDGSTKEDGYMTARSVSDRIKDVNL